MGQAFNGMLTPPNSAKDVYEQGKWLNEQMNSHREKLIRTREVEDSILLTGEQQKITNTKLEHAHKLNQDQVQLMAALVEGQNAILKEQARSAEEAKRTAQVQFWMNLTILILTIISVGYVAIEFHRK